MMRMETSDEALAIAAGRGDRAAFAALLKRRYPWIHRLAWRLTGSATEADDLAQEAALRLGRTIRQYRGEARFTTWAYRLVLNTVRDAARRRGAETRALDRFAEDQNRMRAEAAEAGEAGAWLAEALERLKPELRETAALVVGEGLTQAEAAEVLEIPEGTVAWRMSEVKKALAALARVEAET